jgi:hypothetical protein
MTGLLIRILRANDGSDHYREQGTRPVLNTIGDVTEMTQSSEELRKRVVSWGTDYTTPHQVRVREAKRLLDFMLKYIKELEHGHDAHFKNQAERIDELTRALSDLLPYTDSIVCYASTISEHEGNRVAKVLADLAEKLK